MAVRTKPVVRHNNTAEMPVNTARLQRHMARRNKDQAHIALRRIRRLSAGLRPIVGTWGALRRSIVALLSKMVTIRRIVMVEQTAILPKTTMARCRRIVVAVMVSKVV